MKGLLFVLFFFQLVTAQEREIFAGKGIVDSVSVSGSDGESYAIYFPEKYNKENASAVVFIFEPVARGKIGLSPFVSASDFYNYVLVCSNNSKNGSLQNNKDIASRLIEHVVLHYKIDSNQMYVAGFSGGSRLAGSLALNAGIFQGVIGCGASFQPFDRFIQPANNFSYVGLVGYNDMNYQEMVKNRSWLNKTNIKNELLVSEDGHVWPDNKQILRAFDWLELQAYKKGIRKTNDSLINELYLKNIKIADSLSVADDLVGALMEYERINANYSSKFIEPNLKEKIATIKNSKKYKQEIKEMESVAVLEEEIANRFSAQFDQDLKRTDKGNDFKFWKAQMKYFEENSNAAKGMHRQKMINRLKYKMRAMVYEAGEDFKRLNEGEKYTFCRQLLEALKKN